MMKKLLLKVPGTLKLFAVCIVLGLAGGGLIIVEASYLAQIVNGAFMKGLGLAALFPVLVVLLGWIGLRAVVQTASDYVSSRMALRIKSDLRIRLLQKIADLGPNYAKGERSGELISTVYEGVEQLETYLARYLPQMALSMLIPAAVFCFVAGLDWLSALVLAITFPLLIIFMILVGMAAKSKAQKQFKTLGRLGGHFLDVLRGLPTLQIFNRSRAQIEIISRISEEYRKTTMGTLRLAFLSAFVMELFATLSTAIVAVFLGLRLIAGEIGFEHAFLVLLLTPEFYVPVRALGTQFHASTNGMAAAARILDILETESPGWMEREGSPHPVTSPKGYKIEFQAIGLTYPGENRAAISNLTLTLEPGERVAVIGPSGSGKSSLLDVLQGFIRPTEGRILIDGMELSELSMTWWREQLSIVSQNPRLYHGTLKDNLTMGCQDVVETDMTVSLLASGVDFIDRLPQGIETMMGESVRLSGGQVQRIAIARALLKQAPILLLDEPTSGLDLIHEAVVRKGLNEQLKDRMSITVAHRLETVQNADRIIVMESGRIAEIGTPAELLAAGGLYARMMEANSRGEMEEDQNHFEVHLSTAGEAAEVVSQPDSGQASRGKEDTSIRRGTFLRMLEFVRPYKGRTALAVLLGCLTIAANVGLMGTSGYLIAQAALRPESVLLLWIPIVGVRFFGLSRGVFRYLERLVSHDLTFRILHRIRVWLYERLEPNGVKLLEKGRSGELLHAVIGDVEQLQNVYLRVLAPPLVALLTGLLGCIVMAVHHVELAILLACMLLFAGVGIPWFSARSAKSHGEAIMQARGRMYAETADLIAGVKDLTVFGSANNRVLQIDEIQTRSNVYQTNQLKVAAYASGGMLGAAHLSMWLILAASVYLASRGQIEGVAIPALAMITLACFEAVTPLPAALQNMGLTLSSANRLFQIADESQIVEDMTKRTEQIPLEPAASEWNDCLPDDWSTSIHGLSFRYGPEEPYAIRDLSMTLKRGTMTAIVGESGAGKSTLLHLLLKLRTYTEGSIRMNGRELRDLPASLVRSEFAVVSQNAHLFNASVNANLRLSCPDATEDELREAARLAQIDGTIDQFPHGYETVIGEWGSLLSGGERQRLALARALLRKSPAVLFDEPSTGLDALTEMAIRSNLDTLLKDKAVLWITHKLAGLERMNEIIVMHDGCVQERGTHFELLRRRGYYYRLWQLEKETDWQHTPKSEPNTVHASA
ncbi:thiol reductant ABC exporter subunit CydD [Paenibacillus sp. SYP-B3998]|uniref:Thiol reductant ABC exporter subunit CydD n=1 Tax=Paenibacillus sp. SYP-B3998 TaxID=2678564 RepID=A0A6G3ZT14_9BACL|nr:thiol reductant ABC exporter subunit CydD [Paenibacillus sp. SYP-B3998]NEW04844.1 thiol reductant ABC exporter subunit CydD [Paenibacillus sp. SYP-B3998]